MPRQHTIPQEKRDWPIIAEASREHPETGERWQLVVRLNPDPDVMFDATSGNRAIVYAVRSRMSRNEPPGSARW